MRNLVAGLLLLIALDAQAQKIDPDLYKRWTETQERGERVFSSKRLVPVTGSEKLVSEAKLMLSTQNPPQASSLTDLINRQIQDVRASQKLAELSRNDGGNGSDEIIAHIEFIKGQDVGFIRYSSFGPKDKPAETPRLVTHASFLRANRSHQLKLVKIDTANAGQLNEDHRLFIRALMAK